MKKKITPLLISLGIIGLAGCSNDNAEEENNAETDGDDISFGDVLSSSDAGEVTTDDILNEIGAEQVANQTFQLTLDEILMDKYSDEVDRDEILEDVDNEIEGMGGEEQVEMMLQQQGGMTIDEFKNQSVTSAYHDQFFAEQFDITDEEAKEEVREGSHILISVDSGDDETPEGEEGLPEDEAREKAEDLIEQLEEDDADFGELASEESDDTGSAENNGELGYVQRGQMDEAFEDALFELEPGEMTSEPVESEFGFHIIQRGNEENIDDELSEIKSQIVNQRVQENPEEVLSMYQELLDEYNVEFENDEIRSFIEENYLQSDEEEDTEESNENETDE